jgi:Domain of unknown function (DUF3854)
MTNPEQLMAEYLDERGISLKYAKQAGLKAVDAEMAERMGFPYARRSQAGVVSPYLHPLTRKPHDTLMRIRYLGELPLDSNGEPIRYAQPKLSGVEAFFDANIDWLEVMRDASIGIAITEGEAKALYMNQHRKALGAVTIGLGGVWNFRDKGTGDLTPWLRMIRAARSWSGGDYIIAFDSDMATNSDIQHAAAKLAELLGLARVRR